MRQYAELQRRLCGSMRNCSKDYAAVCGSTNDEYAAVCGIAVETMRQHADRVVTLNRHPAVFAVGFQRDEIIIPAARIGRMKQYYVIQQGNYTLSMTNTCDIIASSILVLICLHTFSMALPFRKL